MNSKTIKIFFAAALCFMLTGGPAQACSWAAFANGNAAVVARTMDWYCADNASVYGHGRNMTVKAADTPNALEYTSKYASLQFHSFGDLVIEAMNEKGLQGSILFLEGSELPLPRAGRKDVNPNQFISYVVSNFATVQEAVDNLDRINFSPAHMNIPGPGGKPLNYKIEKWPGHFALADATGDKAVIEFIGGKVTVYHGRQYDAMTNEPPYQIHLFLDSMGYQPNGSITPQDRRSRAKNYLRDMYERKVETPQRALLAMRGLLASVHAGTEEIDRVENEVYPTIWSVLADQKGMKYYLSRYDSWCWEIYDFSLFNPEKPEAAALKTAKSPYEKIDTDSSR